MTVITFMIIYVETDNF